MPGLFPSTLKAKRQTFSEEQSSKGKYGSTVENPTAMELGAIRNSTYQTTLQF